MLTSTLSWSLETTFSQPSGTYAIMPWSWSYLVMVLVMVMVIVTKTTFSQISVRMSVFK